MTTEEPGAACSEGVRDASLEQILDDLIERLQSGEDLDLEALIGEHLGHAGSIRRLGPALKALVDFGEASARGPLGLVLEGGARVGVLGDFRIVREVGRGGMGVVYEAEQISLRRRVALKVLPTASAVDPRQQQRFQLEAHAAAALHHANIVPVYAVGAESGTSYYAMQFIEGRSLAQLISELRRLAGLDPPEGAPRGLACLTTRTLAASLLAEAPPPPGAATEPEAEGRAQGPAPPGAPQPSISPGSGPDDSTRARAYLLSAARLGREAAEALDHAHAHGILHRDIKPDNLLVDLDGRLWVTDFGLAQIQGDQRLTVSGDVMGTLRYMSPEQALGRRIVVDGRSDLYSLGATLYELLTLRPAYEGRDRVDVLRRITTEEPTPIRKLNPAVPADLATIVHKTMSKEPADRYGTARDLAEDLGRFLQDRPILARPPSVLDRLAKWSRRHAAAIVAAGAVLMAVVVVLAVGIVIVSREQGLTASALRVAREQRNLARQAVDDMYTQVAKRWLADQPKLTAVQKEFLEKALAFYEQFAAAPGADPEMQLSAARASREVGEIRYAIGRIDESWDAHGRSVALCQDLVDRFPERPEYRLELSRSMLRLGTNQAKLGNVGHASRLFRRALELAMRLADEEPRDRELLRHLAAVHYAVGEESDLRRAADLYESLLRDPAGDAGFRAGVRVELAATALRLGSVQHNRSRYDEAEALYLRVADLLQSLSTRDARSRRCHAVALMDLGSVRWSTGRIEEALVDLQRSRDMLESLIEEFPDFMEYASLLAFCCRVTGYVLLDAGRFEEAGRIGRRGMELIEKLVEHHPSVPGDRAELGGIVSMIADLESCLPEDPSSDGQAALRIVTRAMSQGCLPSGPSGARSLGWARYRAGDWKGCLEALGGDPGLRGEGDFFRAMARWRLGDETGARAEFERADRGLPGDDARRRDGLGPAPRLLRQVRSEAASLLGLDREGRDQAAVPPTGPR